MQEKTFYDRIIEDEQLFDKVIYDVEYFINNAPTAKARQLGQMVKQGLTEIKAISNHCSKVAK